MAKSFKDIEREFSRLSLQRLSQLILSESRNLIGFAKDLRLRSRLPRFHAHTVENQVAEKYHCVNIKGTWVQNYYDTKTKEFKTPTRILSILNGKESKEENKTKSTNQDTLAPVC